MIEILLISTIHNLMGELSLGLFLDLGGNEIRVTTGG